jgi:uncharacterized DUF497 family protein
MALFTLGNVVFEWDDAKADSNLSKYGVSFFEAATVFRDRLGLLKRDIANSDEEDRFVLIGTSFELRMVAVAHVERGTRLRIISARAATPRERREYERRDR